MEPMEVAGKIKALGLTLGGIDIETGGGTSSHLYRTPDKIE